MRLVHLSRQVRWLFLLLNVLALYSLQSCSGPTEPSEPSIASVSILPQTHTFTSGDEVLQLSAEAYDAEGNVLANKDYSWSTLDSNVVELIPGLQNQAEVRPRENGTATINVSSEGIIGTAEIVVDIIPPVTGDWSGVIPGLGLDISITESPDGDIDGGGSILIVSSGSVLIFPISVSGQREEQDITMLITSAAINDLTFNGTINSAVTIMAGRLTTTTGLDVPFTFSRDNGNHPASMLPMLTSGSSDAAKLTGTVANWSRILR